jgi:hypothetical protein
MGTRLVNVRLDEVRVNKARRLRQRGVVLSELVREAIDARFEAEMAAPAVQSGRAIVARLFEEVPDPPDQPRRAYDVHDAREARAAVVGAIRRRRP